MLYRRVCTWVIALLLLTPMTALYAQAEGWSDWVILREATCTENGVRTRTHTDGRTESAEIGAPGHTMEETIAEPGCATTGERTLVCLVCGFTEREVTGEPLEHSYVKTLTINAPCDVEGLVEYRCERCGAVKSELIPAKGHTYGGWVVEKQATTETEGLRCQTCIYCNERLYETVPIIQSETTGALTPLEKTIISLDALLILFAIFVISLDIHTILWDRRRRKKTKAELEDDWAELEDRYDFH